MQIMEELLTIEVRRKRQTGGIAMPCNAKKEIGCPEGRKCCDCDYYEPYVCETESEADKGHAVLSNSTDGLYGKLTHIAASLLKARLSDFEEDYPKRFPKHVLRDIERHNECLRTLACQLIDLKRAL